jgi:regulator of sirC expression with transglutaminase-like and TPR domain
MDLDATLAALAADPRLPVDLAELALHLAADEYPDLDVPAYLARIEALADAVRPRLAAGSLAERTAELAHFLFEEHGFAGNADDYYDPRNSYLNEVLDRKLGLPITLSVLAAAVGARAGLRVEGVGLPGHFVAKAVDDSGHDVLFDPFHGGQLLDAAGCERLIAEVTGQPFTLDEAATAATPPGLIAARMLTNLKGAYLKLGEFRRAAKVIRRLVQLDPADPGQRRDLGVSLFRAGDAGPAIGHLRNYLERVPDADDALVVREFLNRATAAVARWN